MTVIVYFCYMRWSLLMFSAFLFNTLVAQQQFTVMTYNLLNYPDADTALRNKYYREVICYAQPDILLVQELGGEQGLQMLNKCIATCGPYKAGVLIPGPDSDNAIFYDSTKFYFINNQPITTDTRDISKFTLLSYTSADSLWLYAVHLKSSTGSANQNSRAMEVDSLRKVTDKHKSSDHFIVCGDFNIYASSEPAYQKLLEKKPGKYGHVVDVLNLKGLWNDITYSGHHTQSTRTRKIGYGATGGLDDRFDMIFFSESFMDSLSFEFANSYYALGNDGSHYKDSVSAQPNSSVPYSVANALHFASDHLPVIAKISLSSTMVEEKIVPPEPQVYYESQIGIVWVKNVDMNTLIQTEMYDAKGTMLLSAVHHGENSLYAGHLSRGFYLVKLSWQTGFITQKLFVE